MEKYFRVNNLKSLHVDDLPLCAGDKLTLAERRLEGWRGGGEMDTHTHTHKYSHRDTSNSEAR